MAQRSSDPWIAVAITFIILSALVLPAYAGNVSPGISDGATTKKAGNISPGISDSASTTAVTPVPTPYQPSGSGTSTGGGGLITDEPMSNIDQQDRLEKDLRADRPTLYTFAKAKLPVYEILVQGNENEYGIMVGVYLLKDKSGKTPTSPAGEVYRHINIYSGSQRIKSATIRFKVPVDWANSKEAVWLARWTGKDWTLLTTSEIRRDATTIYYEATVTGFSNFAIVGTTAAKPTPPTSTVTTQPEVTPTPTQTMTAVPTTTPGFGILGLIVAISLLLILRRAK